MSNGGEGKDSNLRHSRPSAAPKFGVLIQLGHLSLRHVYRKDGRLDSYFAINVYCDAFKSEIDTAAFFLSGWPTELWILDKDA